MPVIVTALLAVLYPVGALALAAWWAHSAVKARDPVWGGFAVGLASALYPLAQALDVSRSRSVAPRPAVGLARLFGHDRARADQRALSARAIATATPHSTASASAATRRCAGSNHRAIPNGWWTHPATATASRYIFLNRH